MQSRRVWLTISMMVRTPRPSSPTSWPTTPASSISLEAFDRSPSLSFSRWIRIGLRPAVGPPAGDEEAAEPAGRLGQHQEAVGHGRRAEPFVAGKQVGARSVRIGLGPGRVGPDVGAALLFGQGHAAGHADLLGGGAVGRVVGGRADHRLPPGRHLGLVTQRRHDGVGHRHRTDVAGVHLVPDDHLGRPGDVGPGAGIGPGPGVQPVGRSRSPISSWYAGWYSTTSTRCPNRSWVCSSGRYSLARRPSSWLEADPASDAERRQPGPGPPGPLPVDRLPQGAVGAEDVVALERWHLVEDLVGVDQYGHGILPAVERSRHAPVGTLSPTTRHPGCRLVLSEQLEHRSRRTCRRQAAMSAIEAVSDTQSPPSDGSSSMTKGMVALFATACGISVASLYYRAAAAAPDLPGFPGRFGHRRPHRHRLPDRLRDRPGTDRPARRHPDTPAARPGDPGPGRPGPLRGGGRPGHHRPDHRRGRRRGLLGVGTDPRPVRRVPGVGPAAGAGGGHGHERPAPRHPVGEDLLRADRRGQRAGARSTRWPV